MINVTPSQDFVQSLMVVDNVIYRYKLECYDDIYHLSTVRLEALNQFVLCQLCTQMLRTWSTVLMIFKC